MAAPVEVSAFHSGSFQQMSQSTVDSLDPSHPEVCVAVASVCGRAEIEVATSAAQEALGSWKNLTGPARADHLYAWADRISARSDELAMAISIEVGKPIGEARGEVGRCVAILRFYAGEAVRPTGEVIPPQVGSALQYAIRVPLGVVALVTPWNFPLAIPLWKAAPALAVGNTIVLKPSEHSSYCAKLLAETSIGLPAGVFNVVPGDGSTGSALLEDNRVKAVSFTGSVITGLKIQTSCAARNIKVQCEMGGKNAAVILQDADLPRAAQLVAGGAMRFAGQKCTATSRAVVVAPVWDAFLAELSQAIDALPVGPVTEAPTAVGPVITEASHRRLTQALESASADQIYQSSARGEGYYVPPTVFGSVDRTDKLVQEELFGPVLTLQRARDLNEAIELANDTSFGLSTAVYTQNVKDAFQFIDRVEAGLVRVNGDTTGVDPHAPFGGTKASSSGTREQGEVAKDFYTEWKTVQINQ